MTATGDGLLAGRRILVTGVLNGRSLAFHTAALAQKEGATVILSAPAATARHTARAAARLPRQTPVVELDVTAPADLAALPDRLRGHLDGTDGLDGVVHAIAYAPPEAMGGGFLKAGWPQVAQAMEISAYSLQALTVACLPLLGRGSSVVGLDFDASVAWPDYDWMGVAKAALESTARYLARDLGPAGINVNLVAAGPVRTLAARGIPGAESFEALWAKRAPLGWDSSDPEPVARACVALLSDWFPRTTGEIVHVDGGFHATGA
ncbi:enoyl-ACP reductase FabI [Streptomyces sp. NPDC020681]|uniref:enoyl-ACP reductase FabI n=1 Tax=Streptomyces sp. NPDC020681 TaxID=3365083 RepID=UPI0037A9DB6F